jgi:fatty-acyl-CoA synthase
VTAATIEDGWLHSGDVAMRDEDGYYYIVDRVKDMYISGGENVYPAEIENAIYQLPEIGEVAVIGLPDEKWGEVGRAFVVIKPGNELSEADIIEHCRANLAHYKAPRRVVFGMLPKTSTGKIQKYVLRERAHSSEAIV